MKLNDFPNIEKFLDLVPNSNLEIGKIGFGRPCVGLMDSKTECYFAYEVSDDEYNTIAQHSAAYKKIPREAYHKGPYLAVLMHPENYDLGPSDVDKQEALQALNDWLGPILKAGFEVYEYEERDSIACLLAGKPTITQRAIVNKKRRRRKK